MSFQQNATEYNYTQIYLLSNNTKGSLVKREDLKNGAKNRH